MKLWSLAAASLAALLATCNASIASPITEVIYFTTFNGGGPDVWMTTASYSGNGTKGNGTFSPGTAINIASTPGADGIVFNPNDHQLLVGGQSTGKIYQVDPSGGNHWSAYNAGAAVHEITVAPGGKVVWGGNSEGSTKTISSIPINPLGGTPTVVAVHGANHSVTHIAFVPGQSSGMAFYTSSGDNGHGNFGLINLATGTTTALIKNALFAHGMIYDPFTGDLILAGGDEIAQINPKTDAVVSTAFFRNNIFDQGAVDGKGHLFWADNRGDLLFIDYSNTKLIGSAADFTSDKFFMNKLDDLAPLVGTGSNNPGVPEPMSLCLFGGALATVVALRRRRKRVTT